MDIYKSMDISMMKRELEKMKILILRTGIISYKVTNFPFFFFSRRETRKALLPGEIGRRELLV